MNKQEMIQTLDHIAGVLTMNSTAGQGWLDLVQDLDEVLDALKAEEYQQRLASYGIGEDQISLLMIESLIKFDRCHATKSGSEASV